MQVEDVDDDAMTFAAGLRVGGARVCSLVLPPPVIFSNHAIA
jgi:hypothetical protein